MDYTLLQVTVADELQAEILTAELADYPFESFESEAGVLKAYLPTAELPSCRDAVDALLARRGVTGSYHGIATQNWNACWEEDFTPVDIEGRLRIRAPHHEAAPAGEAEVVIRPRMAFGTGHHATTWLMSRAVLDLEVKGRRGLDVGSGTGVLSIVAALGGAACVDAVDIDDWADENCRANVAANGVADRVCAIRGDIRSVAGRRYDFILANINRNVLLADMEAYDCALEAGGDLLMSGFLLCDADQVACAAEKRGLKCVARAEREGWVMLHVRKVL